MKLARPLSDQPKRKIPLHNYVHLATMNLNSEEFQFSAAFMSGKMGIGYHLLSNKLVLPPLDESKKGIVVFDIDETLVHVIRNANQNQQAPPGFTRIRIQDWCFDIKVRPHAQELLSILDQHAEIGVFTEGDKPFADILLHYVDPNSLTKFRFYQHNCLHVHGRYIKPLALLNQDMKKVITIDDSWVATCGNYKNAINIKPYHGESDDRELHKLEPVLLRMLNELDVQQSIKDTFPEVDETVQMIKNRRKPVHVPRIFT
jgi:Dullard-like phosphatase family protein